MSALVEQCPNHLSLLTISAKRIYSNVTAQEDRRRRLRPVQRDSKKVGLVSMKPDMHGLGETGTTINNNILFYSP